MPEQTAPVKRFEQDADPDAKREFAVSLIGALDTLSVEPGQLFRVTTQSFVAEMERRIADAEDEANEARCERENALNLLNRLQEVLEDFRVGLRDKDELLREVRDLQDDE